MNNYEYIMQQDLETFAMQITEIITTVMRDNIDALTRKLNYKVATVTNEQEKEIFDYVKEWLEYFDNDKPKQTNYNKIRSMSVDEMAEWFETNDLDMIELVCSDSESIKQWLESEVRE